jgi:glycosyltransferase involved in cell wall biosynthesis
VALGAAAGLILLFPYLARARAANWSRYQQLLSACARAGCEVRMLEPPPRLSSETNFHDAVIGFPPGLSTEEVRLPSWFWNRRFPFDKIVKKGAYSLAANARVRRLVGEHRPDVILVYNVTQKSLLSLGVPAVFDVADDLPAMLRVEAGIFGPLAERLARRTLARMIAKAALVTTPSRVLLPRLGPRASFVPNGVDPEEIAAARLGADSPSGAAYRVGFLGSFEYFIQFDLVVELAARLPDVRFLLIGGGRRLEEIRERIHAGRLANVELAGPLPHPEALRRLSSCDVTLAPFTRDAVGHGASPLKLFESLALGVPVIATRTDEIRAERPPNVRFADSAEETASVIADLRVQNRETRAAENDRARSEILAARSWTKIARDWLSTLGALARD